MTTTKTIYLDNSSATRPSEQAIGKMLPYFTEYWGSPSSPHKMGQQLYPAIADGYKALYACLGASHSDTIILTSSGAEAVNHVIQSTYIDVTRPTGRNHFVTSNIDEAPSILAIGRLEQLGCASKMADADKRGMVTAHAVSEAITPRTALVSLSWANGLTGVVNPVADIAKICHDRAILFHLDASHVIGKLFFELPEIGADLITFNGDIMHGPKGTGVLYIREGLRLSPLLLGGSQQGGLRAGDLNVPGLVSLGVACQEALENRNLLCTEVARLRHKLEQGVLDRYPEAHLFFADEERVPHITSIAFPGIANEVMLYALSRQGLCASIGGGSFQQIGLVLQASGIPEALAHSAVSFSLSRATYEDEIDRAIDIIVKTAQKLRRISEKVVPN